MKTNLSFLALFALPLLSSPNLAATPAATPAAEVPFAFPDECAQVVWDGNLYFSPVHPGVALQEARLMEAYPCVNASLAGDLCGIDGSPVPSREIRRRSDYLSVELAEVSPKSRAPLQAVVNPVLALPLLLILLFRSRTSRFPA